MRTVVETAEFLRRSSEAGLSEDDRRNLVDLLAENPETGVSLGGGLRKMRFARQGEGKSGRFRVIHFYRLPNQAVFLLTVFAKNEQANISRKEQTLLVQLCDEIAGTYGDGT